MKKNRKNVPLGRRSTEVAGSLTPDLEDLHASRQHADRSYAGHSGEADGGRLHENRGDIVPHLGRQGGEHCRRGKTEYARLRQVSARAGRVFRRCIIDPVRTQ